MHSIILDVVDTLERDSSPLLLLLLLLLLLILLLPSLTSWLLLLVCLSQLVELCLEP
jgi:hypothetical protein